MSQSRNVKNDGDQPALDPNERWGQGTDASHPISSLEPLDSATPTADSADVGTDSPAGRKGTAEDVPDDMPLT